LLIFRGREYFIITAGCFIAGIGGDTGALRYVIPLRGGRRSPEAWRAKRPGTADLPACLRLESRQSGAQHADTGLLPQL